MENSFVYNKSKIYDITDFADRCKPVKRNKFKSNTPQRNTGNARTDSEPNHANSRA